MELLQIMLLMLALFLLEPKVPKLGTRNVVTILKADPNHVLLVSLLSFNSPSHASLHICVCAR